MHEELVWDLRALQAADSVTDERVRQAGLSGPASGLYPSLYLNLGEVYRKLGDLDRARAHLEQGRASVGALGDDGYVSPPINAQRMSNRVSTATIKGWVEGS